MSRTKLSGYVGHVTIFSCMFTIACCLGWGYRITVRIRFSVWLASCYAHVFVLLSIVIVTLPK